MRVILDPEAVSRGLRRVAGELAERHGGARGVVLVGVRRGGVPLAERLAALMAELEGQRPLVGTLDITLYRDDAATALANPRIGPSALPVEGLDGRHVVLVDDVVHTGRTVRAGIDALMDHGRPRRIELCALVDRGGRELPIQPDYVVTRLTIEDDEHIDLRADDHGNLFAVVVKRGTPSQAPPP